MDDAQAVCIDVLAADGFNDQGVPQHGRPCIVAGHLTDGVVTGSLDVGKHLEHFVIGGGEGLPAGLGKDFLVVNDGEDGALEGENVGLAVNAPRVEAAVGEVIAPAVGEVRGQIHELAGFLIRLNVEGGVKNADVGCGAGGNGGADLIAVCLIVGLLLNDDLDGAGILGVEVLDHLCKIGGLGVGADPDAREVDDYLPCRGVLVFRGLLGLAVVLCGLLCPGAAAGSEGEAHRQRKDENYQSLHFFHFVSPFVV